MRQREFSGSAFEETTGAWEGGESRRGKKTTRRQKEEPSREFQQGNTWEIELVGLLKALM